MGKLLRYSGTIYVPTIRVSALEAIKAEALDRLGGYTATPGEGGWVSPSGATNVQPVVVVKVWSEDDHTIRHWVVDSVHILKNYGEEAVMYETTVSGLETSAGVAT